MKYVLHVGIKKFLLGLAFLLVLAHEGSVAFAGENYDRALKRAQYLLNESVPTDEEFANNAKSRESYRSVVRTFLDSDRFYHVMMRYHQRLLGVGLPPEYLDELKRDDIDDKTNKFAKILCGKSDGSRLTCSWASAADKSKVSSCPVSWEKAVSIFWYPGIVAWVCPSVLSACGSDLSRCFIQYDNEEEAKNSELGTTEAFDSRFAVIKSLSLQPAGLATAVVVQNFPYTKILSSGLTAVDGSIAHLYRQQHHFDLNKMHLSPDLVNIVNDIALTDTRFRLVNLEPSYDQGGILSTFGFLRRYEKNRTRGNELYKRLLCRSFIATPPAVFPQDPGNLREAPGCSGCHKTLDPLADFFLGWGEGGDLYAAGTDSIDTTFGGQSGKNVQDLSGIIANDTAFATCTVENIWSWLMGRGFFTDEAKLRAGLTNYFIQTDYSLKELVYALATHPAFIEGARTDALVGDPLAAPPLGIAPGEAPLAPCETQLNYDADVAPGIKKSCGTCHDGANAARQNLTTEDAMNTWASQSISMMASGNMPPGQAGPPLIGPVFDLKESVRCWQEKK
jgi:hypothetical protein